MHRSAISFASYLTLAVAAVVACGPAPLEVPDSAPPPGSGGTGNTGAGGTSGSGVGGVGGGVGATGGVTSVGGAGGVGGAVAGTGGTLSGAGGSVAGTGGAVAGTGGAVAGAGGSAGVATGGASGAGASGASGSGAGTSAVACDAAFVVDPDGFVRAPAAGGGCWHGYSSVGGDTASTVTPKDFAACGAGCMLTAMGTVGPAVAPDYAGTIWLGFNLNQAAGGGTTSTVTPAGTSLVVNYTSTGPAVRVQIAAGSTRWCAPLTSSPATIPYTMFNTECWEGGMGTAYAMQPIDAVQLIVPGGAAAAAFTIALVSVKDM